MTDDRADDPADDRTAPTPEPECSGGDQLVDLWLGARRAVAALERAMESRLQAEVGISSPRYALLCATGAPGATNQQGISAALGLNKSSISRQVEAAVQDGHLAAHASPGSRRDKEVVLTPAGRALLDRADAVLATLARDIDPREADIALRVLDGLGSAAVR
ncbi:MarR family winged helix-turn-helix transcriptional regulator [Sanguibacter sp. 25GB23B1]|uniref:MarR family winged helix-turn-helix transcriptional regulator n=1 Tax=unclassified Sanguibacter TaxID=2645534 RepID=UPI0032AE8838